MLARVMFWVSAGMLAYTYLGYPLLIGILALFRRREPVRSKKCPSLSVLIAAYNEEAALEEKIRATLALDYPAGALEVVVVSDGSADRTAAIATALAARDERIKLVDSPFRIGKTAAQNLGVRRCRGEVIVFSDATTRYHPQALRRLADRYADPEIGAVSGRYQYLDASGRPPTGLGSRAFWGYENLIKLSQSRLGTLTGCSGCIYSVRRELYVPLPPNACSDLVEPLAVLRRGYRIAFEPEALAYEETTTSTAREFGMRVRVIAQGMAGLWSMRELLDPRRHPWLAFQLFCHKVLRWSVPIYLVMLAAGAGLAMQEPFYCGCLWLQAAFYGLATAALILPLHRLAAPLGLPLYFCTLNAAALVAAFQAWRGERFATWETVRS